jgi:hypothetical protein
MIREREASMPEETSLNELRDTLKDPGLKQSFFREIKNDFGIREAGTMNVITCMIENIVILERMNDWCVPKTLYTRANVKTSLNLFYYHVIPKLITIGFLEMKMYVSPSGEHKRVVRMSEDFVVEKLCPMMKKLNKGEL